MNSVKCQSCSLVQWAVNPNCKRCGAPIGSPEPSFQTPPAPYAHEQSAYGTPVNFAGQSSPMPPYGFNQNLYSSPVPPQLKTGLALASMIIGIIAFPMTFLLVGILLAPVAVILGIVAIRKASKQPYVYGGKGFAIAGIAVGSVICVFFVPLIAAIAIPNLLAARRAANEGSAISTVKTIAIAQNAYASMDEEGSCGDLFKLASRNLIGGDLAAGRKNGYKFVAQGSMEDGCEVLASPETRSHGTRSFYYSSYDGVLRVSTDGPADENDSPLESTRASN